MDAKICPDLGSDADRERLLQERERKATVYLAATSINLAAERNTILCELQDHGYRVLPDDDLEHTMPVHMDRAGLSVHICDPQDENVFTQAYEAAKGHNIFQVVWVPAKMMTQDAERSQVVRRLRRESRFNLELLLPEEAIGKLKWESNTIDRLKEVVLHKLAPPVVDMRTLALHIECHPDDQAGALEVKEYLQKQGFEVNLPIFEVNLPVVPQQAVILEADQSARQEPKEHLGTVPLSSSESSVKRQATAQELSRWNRQTLNRFDRVLLYCDRVPDKWVKNNWENLDKALGLRSRPFDFKAIYAPDPKRNVPPGIPRDIVINDFSKLEDRMKSLPRTKRSGLD